jgi:GMP synthase (glutamine-hydrolysing)
MNVDEGEAHPWLPTERALLGELLERRVPLVGLCLGGQMVAQAAGAVPRRAPRPEIGWHSVELTNAGREDPLLGPLGSSFEAFQWHSYEFPAR